MTLSGSNIIVTGGSSGIGMACCIEAAKEGANVAIITHSRLGAAQEVAKEVESFGRKAVVIQCDVSDPQSVVSMVNQAYDAFGKVDCLINNAGIAHVSKAEELTLHDWKRIIDTDLTGAFLCAQEVGKRMIEQGAGGSIVNIASVSGHKPVRPDIHCHYNAAKAGLIMLSKSLAYEWAPHKITVNSISPGYVMTNMTKDCTEYHADWISQIPLGRIGSPEDVAYIALFLASAKARFVTGADWIVDGGGTL